VREEGPGREGGTHGLQNATPTQPTEGRKCGKQNGDLKILKSAGGDPAEPETERGSGRGKVRSKMR